MGLFTCFTISCISCSLDCLKFKSRLFLCQICLVLTVLSEKLLPEVYQEDDEGGKEVLKNKAGESEHNPGTVVHPSLEQEV